MVERIGIGGHVTERTIAKRRILAPVAGSCQTCVYRTPYNLCGKIESPEWGARLDSRSQCEYHRKK